MKTNGMTKKPSSARILRQPDRAADPVSVVAAVAPTPVRWPMSPTAPATAPKAMPNAADFVAVATFANASAAAAFAAAETAVTHAAVAVAVVSVTAQASGAREPVARAARIGTGIGSSERTLGAEAIHAGVPAARSPELRTTKAAPGAIASMPRQNGAYPAVRPSSSVKAP